jgi:hypothetical protein
MMDIGVDRRRLARQRENPGWGRWMRFNGQTVSMGASIVRFREADEADVGCRHTRVTQTVKLGRICGSANQQRDT